MKSYSNLLAITLLFLAAPGPDTAHAQGSPTINYSNDGVPLGEKDLSTSIITGGFPSSYTRVPHSTKSRRVCQGGAGGFGGTPPAIGGISAGGCSHRIIVPAKNRICGYWIAQQKNNGNASVGGWRVKDNVVDFAISAIGDPGGSTVDFIADFTIWSVSVPDSVSISEFKQYCDLSSYNLSIHEQPY